MCVRIWTNMRHLCTYFDINFVPRGRALLDSLTKQSESFILYILALDEQTLVYLKSIKHPNVQLITLEEYIKYFNIDRSKYKTEKEFYFSIKPSLCLYLMELNKEIDLLLYVDSDMYFYNDLELLYNEIGNASIAMCHQHLPWYLSKKYGIYNAGFVAFKNDDEGVKCLHEWYKNCSVWDVNQKGYELSFFSDQVWLTAWPLEYKNVKIIMHKGVNTAPWNANQYNFTQNDGKFYVDGVPLILYHFSSIRQLKQAKWHVNTAFTILNVKDVLKRVYVEYLLNVEKYISTEKIENKELKVSGNRLKTIISYISSNIHNHIVEF